MIIQIGHINFMGGRANSIINEYERVTRILKNRLSIQVGDDETRKVMMAAIRIGFADSNEEKMSIMRELGIKEMGNETENQ